VLRRVELAADRAAEQLAELGWSDGLPVVPPTPERVEAALDALGAVGARGARDDGEAAATVLGSMPPSGAPVTVEKVAVCAVLAGCEPRAMPVVLAAVRAVLHPDFRVGSVQSSTSPAAPLLVVDGPAADAAGVSSGDGCFGPGAGANLAIGRAVRLVMALVGDARPGRGDPSPLGMPAKVGACFAERDDASPWPPLHVRRGAAPGSSAVTAFAITGCWQISEPSKSVDDVVHQVLHGMISPGQCSQPRLPQSGEQLLLVTPPIAALLAERFAGVEDLQRALFETVRVPLAWVPPYKRSSSRERLTALGIAWDGEHVPLAEGAHAFEVLVAGGDAGVQSLGLSTLTLSRSATVAVDASSARAGRNR
jgi:hypothetical protein